MGLGTKTRPETSARPASAEVVGLRPVPAEGPAGVRADSGAQRQREDDFERPDADAGRGQRPPIGRPAPRGQARGRGRRAGGVPQGAAAPGPHPVRRRGSLAVQLPRLRGQGPDPQRRAVPDDDRADAQARRGRRRQGRRPVLGGAQRAAALQRRGRPPGGRRTGHRPTHPAFHHDGGDLAGGTGQRGVAIPLPLQGDGAGARPAENAGAGARLRVA